MLYAEVSTWKHVWNALTELYPTRACDEFNQVLAELRAGGLYGPDRLPQVAEVNEYIKSRTGKFIAGESSWEEVFLEWKERNT